MRYASTINEEVMRTRIAELERELDEATAEVKRITDMLSDSATVHVNILRGTIKISRANLIHAAGLPANIEEQLAEARKGMHTTKAELVAEIAALRADLVKMAHKVEVWGKRLSELNQDNLTELEAENAALRAHNERLVDLLRTLREIPPIQHLCVLAEKELASRASEEKEKP